MFSCLLIALAFAAPWSINTIAPMTSAPLFTEAFAGDGGLVGELVGKKPYKSHSFPSSHYTASLNTRKMYLYTLLSL